MKALLLADSLPNHKSALQAVDIYNRRGFDSQSCAKLMSQMQLYMAETAPFDLSFTGADFSFRAWWSSVGKQGRELATLAQFLDSLVPHAAGTERIFSIMGWYNSPRRNRLNVSTMIMMTTVKAQLQLNAPR